VVIVGDGPRRAFLERETRRLGIAERVRFVGALDDVRIALAVMDVFIFASRWPEGFGLTLVEAMAAGKPVVAMRMGAIPDIIQHGVSGWLVPPEDPAAIADAAARLLQDRTSAGQMGRQAQQRVRERFGLERMTTEIEAVYREVVRR
jgi:glycosyltransferase involved in cell wall biosynthesis